MKRFILFICSLFICSLTSMAQSPCSLDNSFDSDGKLVGEGNRIGDAAVIQSDGKIIVACNYFGTGHVYLKRYLVNGGVDIAFGTSGTFSLNIGSSSTRVVDMKMFNNKIYVCGNESSSSSTSPFIAVVNANGSYDTGFGSNGILYLSSSFYTSSALYVDKSGNVFVCGSKELTEAFVQKFTSAGAIDNSFGVNGLVTFPSGNTNHWMELMDVNMDQDDKVVLCGKKYKANNGSTIAPFWQLLGIRLNANGSLDNSFANAGMGYYNISSTSFDEARNIHVTASNEYLITGNTYNGNDYDYCTCKLKHDGSLDNTFGTNGWAVLDLTNNNDGEYHLESKLLPDGRILMAGNQGDGDTVHFALAMLQPNGAPDQVFGSNGVFEHIFNQNNNSSGGGMAIGQDGKVVMSGYTRTCANGNCGPLYLAVARYNAVYSPTKVHDEDLNAWYTIFPNPVHHQEKITLTLPTNTIVQHLGIYGINGQLIKLLTQEETYLRSFDVNLKAGLYFYKGETSLGMVQGEFTVID